MTLFAGNTNIIEELYEQGRTVHLRLPAIKACRACQKSSQEVKLRVCTACGEVTYCSTECQEKDWKSHRSHCGKTDRIDLQTFYPFLGYISALACGRRYHPAFDHKIVDDVDRCVLPDGSVSRLLVLGPKVPFNSSTPSPDWWPAGPTPAARRKLMRRIIKEGFLLPKVLSICVALASEIYTTTALLPSDPPGLQFTGRRRVRLQHDHSPIADFGIIRGSVRVQDSDKLAYYSKQDKKFIKGQDPKDHYRIYFTTLSGHDYFLELGMYTFNFGLGVYSTPYSEPYRKLNYPDMGGVPAVFPDREFHKQGIDKIMFEPHKRFSVLRDPRVHEIARWTSTDYCENHDYPLIFEMMQEISGRKCGEDERMVMMELLPEAVVLLRMNLKNRDYINFSLPALCLDTEDPDADQFPPDKRLENELRSFWHQEGKRLSKGKISKEECFREVCDARGSRLHHKKRRSIN